MMFIKMLKDLGCEDPQGILDMVGEDDLFAVISKMVDSLPTHEKEIFSAYYGFREKPRSKKEIAKKRKVSRRTISKQLTESCFSLNYPSRIELLYTAIKDSSWKRNTPEVQELNERVLRLEEQTVELATKLRLVSEKSEKPDDPLQKILIQDCAFSVRIRNALLDENVYTLRDLLKHPEEELLKFRNIGKKSVAEIMKVLASMNYILPLTGEV